MTEKKGVVSAVQLKNTKNEKKDLCFLTKYRILFTVGVV